MTVMDSKRTCEAAGPRMQNLLVRRRQLQARHLLLALTLTVALAWRLNNIAFGLPSMWDPDEPFFMLTGLKLLKEGTLNPGWFGHPGSTTIYLVALVDIAVVFVGLLTGQWENIREFAAAAYADPALLFVPVRLSMAIIAVLCVWLTYVVARRLFGTAAGLIAAALLALNPLHIEWSQVVRTDIHSSLFMLGCLFFSLRAAEKGAIKDYMLAGAFVGLAAATKWPAATVAVAVAGAVTYRSSITGEWGRELRMGGLAMVATIAALFVASPYVFLDWQTVLSNVTGENKSAHLGHTGGGVLENLAWYLKAQLAASMGLIGVLLAAAGAVVAAIRNSLAKYVVLPTVLVLLSLISSQGMIWSRWLLPLLPMACILAAAALVWICDVIGERLEGLWRPALLAGLFVVAAAPSTAGAFASATERANDTRGQAAAWAAAHIEPGSTVVIEHLELSLRHQPWNFLFPIGQAGCINGLKALQGELRYEQVQELRNGSPIIDLGNVSRSKIGSCRADYAILTYYDLYRAEASRYPRELGMYHQVLAGGRTVALFRPQRGEAGGPIVRIVALPQH